MKIARIWPTAVAVAALLFVFGSAAVQSAVTVDTEGLSLSRYASGGVLVPGLNRHVSSAEYVQMLVDSGEFSNGDVLTR